MGKTADGATGQFNSGNIALYLAAIQLQFQRLDWGAGRPMGSGVGAEGSTDIFGRMTGKTADGAVGQFNMGTLLYIWPLPTSNSNTWMKMGTFQNIWKGVALLPPTHKTH